MEKNLNFGLLILIIVLSLSLVATAIYSGKTISNYKKELKIKNADLSLLQTELEEKKMELMSMKIDEVALVNKYLDGDKKNNFSEIDNKK